MFITALVIVVLEKRFITENALWMPIINKAKQRLLELLKLTDDNNEKHDQLEILLNDLRKQI